jgi:phosphomannomutase
MAAYDAAFGGEHSGHYYFRHADTGMLTALHVLAAALGPGPATLRDGRRSVNGARTRRRGTPRR